MMTALKSANDDLLEPSLINDPFPYYRELREHRPVQWNERWRGWIVAGYDDVYAGLHDARMMADTVTPYFETRLSPQDRKRFQQTYEVLNSWSVFVDPPKHTRLRRIFSRSFTPKSVETMRRVVERFVDEFLAAWHGRDDVDDLEARLTAAPDRLLSGDHDHRHRAQMRVGRSRRQIERTGTQRR